MKSEKSEILVLGKNKRLETITFTIKCNDLGGLESLHVLRAQEDCHVAFPHHFPLGRRARRTLFYTFSLESVCKDLTHDNEALGFSVPFFRDCFHHWSLQHLAGR